MKIITIAGLKGVADLDWRLFHSGGTDEEVLMTAQDIDSKFSVFISREEQFIQAGFATKEANKLVSFAKLLAITVVDKSVIQIEVAEGSGYWLSAVTNGTVVPGIDLLFESMDMLIHKVNDLSGDDFFSDYAINSSDQSLIDALKNVTITVTLNTDVVDAIKALAGLKKAPSNLLVKKINLGSTSPATVALLVFLVAGISALGYNMFYSDQEPEIDYEQLKRDAEAALLAQSKRDLTGIHFNDFLNEIYIKSKTLPAIMGSWFLTDLSCTVAASSCSFIYTLNGLGTINDSDLIEGYDISHSFDGKKLSITVPLELTDIIRSYSVRDLDSSANVERLVINGKNLFSMQGAVFKIDKSIAPAIPNINLVEQSKIYKTGSWNLAVSGKSLLSVSNYYTAQPLFIKKFNLKMPIGNASASGVFNEH